MSKDPVKSHLKFAKKFSLPFPLLSDEEGNTLNAYDVYGEKILYGRKYMGIYRTTFLIDEKGKILEVITDVDSKDHAQQIMDLLKK
jgi:peroxiredoxin Q/BCP